MRKNIIRFLLPVVLGLVIMTTCPDSAQARRNRGPVSPAIPEEQRSSPIVPWGVGVVMGAITIMVALKPAKRTHMD